MLYITSYYRIANHNYNELSLHFDQNDNHQKIYERSMLDKVWRKGKPPTQLVAM